MIHALAYVLFILPFTMLLGRELKKVYSLKTHWKWILGALLLCLLGNLAWSVFRDKFGNFLLHTSGGASGVLLFIYLTRTLKLRFSSLLTLILLFAFVCMIG